MLIEIKVKSLVGVVYAELLKTVSAEVLKAKDVENTNRTRLVTTNTQTVTFKFLLLFSKKLQRN